MLIALPRDPTARPPDCLWRAGTVVSRAARAAPMPVTATVRAQSGDVALPRAGGVAGREGRAMVALAAKKKRRKTVAIRGSSASRPMPGPHGDERRLSLGPSRGLFNTLPGEYPKANKSRCPRRRWPGAKMILRSNSSRYGQDAHVEAHVDATPSCARTPALRRRLRNGSGVRPPGGSSPDGRACSCWAVSSGRVIRWACSPAIAGRATRMRPACSEKGVCAPTHRLRYLLPSGSAQHAEPSAILPFRHARRAEIQCGQSRRVSVPATGPTVADREMPNIYLYAANNPSEASLAKRPLGADQPSAT